MHRLTLAILVLFGFIQLHAQSPHGKLLKLDCAACHNPSGWTLNRDSISFDHNTTNFQLEGMHAFSDCKSCHASLIFDEAPSQCLSCHTDVHSMSVGNDCARCHAPDNWLVNNIPEIHEQNGFPLVGTHSNLSCVDCHKSETNLRFDRLGNDCFNCHDDDYTSAKTPDHVAAGYSTNCIECHDPFGTGWGGNIIHDFFPLVDGHAVPDCKQCHLTDNYSDASPVCNTCHMDDYNSTGNPNHASASISTNCADCHTIKSWSPASFDHNTIHPLNGAHATIANDCNKCHSRGFTNTPNTCAGCHMTDYNNTSNPNHTAVGFSTDCAGCHNETAWTPATFDHDADFFPITTGRHKDEWNLCTDCHIGGNYAAFSCIDCHEHKDQANVDDKHDRVSNYSYNSNACFICHPDGEE